MNTKASGIEAKEFIDHVDAIAAGSNRFWDYYRIYKPYGWAETGHQRGCRPDQS
ncbi:hypothetical protein MHH60_25885 [Paenibacillus sp. FSL H7-0716]